MDTYQKLGKDKNFMTSDNERKINHLTAAVYKERMRWSAINVTNEK